MKLHGREITIVGAYAPNEDAVIQLIDRYFD